VIDPGDVGPGDQVAIGLGSGRRPIADRFSNFATRDPRRQERVVTRAEQREIRIRIVIENPVRGVVHSLQSKDGHPLDPKAADAEKALAFEFPVRFADGPKFFGDQVRREGPVRRFVYIRIGQSAGDFSSPWSRRMKIDIHDIDPRLLEQAASGGTLEISVDGTGKDGTPACATVRSIGRRVVRN
jgi:hypothetical protein